MNRELSASVRDREVVGGVRYGMSESKASVPEVFLETHKRLAEWRSTHQRRTRLPEAIWQEAVELAIRHGLNMTARVLRLDYVQLKKRLRPTAPQPSPNFVEIVAGHAISSPRCVIEVESGHGKLRVEMSDAPDWTELLRAFRRA
jgi:hypothetical protein